MSIRLYADGLRCAIYEEAPGGGDPLEPTSLMNRPVINPSGWISNIYFHSDFDYYGTAQYSPSVTLSHAALTGLTRAITISLNFLGNLTTADHLLQTHNLGYIPRFMVAVGDQMIPQGTPIQDGGLGKKRFVCPYATTTEIRLFEVIYTDDTTLSAVSQTYRVLTFDNQAVDPILDQLLIQPGDVVFGQGKFRMDRPPIRAVAPGESPFSIPTSRTAAVRNGSLRVVLPNGSTYDLGPFTGSLPTPSFINVQSGVI